MGSTTSTRSRVGTFGEWEDITSDNFGKRPVMLHWRVIASLVLVPSVIGLFMLDHRIGETAPVLLVVTLGLAILGCWELHRLLSPRFGIRLTPVMIGSIVCATAPWARLLIKSPSALQTAGILGLAFTVAVLLLFMLALVRYREPGNNLSRLAIEVFAVGYIGLLLGFTASLRWVAGDERGYYILGSVLFCAKCGDIGGYTFGRLFGKRKLVPLLSPGKTVSGGVGALLTAAVVGWAWLRFTGPYLSAGYPIPSDAWCLVYGVLIGVTGIIGDLCESLIKRDLQVKDASDLVPGFGGVLDILDSVLYAGPVAYLLWLAG